MYVNFGFNDVGLTESQEWWDPGTPVVFFVSYIYF